MALINLQSTCPACKQKFSTTLLKKQPFKRYEGTIEAGECPHCKAKLHWFHDVSGVVKQFFVVWLGVNVGLFFGAGISIATVIGTAIGVAILSRFIAVNKLKPEETA